MSLRTCQPSRWSSPRSDAAISAFTTGLATETVIETSPFGFCHWAGAPGDLVA
jgi:hypothetical protein